MTNVNKRQVQHTCTGNTSTFKILRHALGDDRAQLYPHAATHYFAHSVLTSHWMLSHSPAACVGLTDVDLVCASWMSVQGSIEAYWDINYCFVMTMQCSVMQSFSFCGNLSKGAFRWCLFSCIGACNTACNSACAVACFKAQETRGSCIMHPPVHTLLRGTLVVWGKMSSKALKSVPIIVIGHKRRRP
jgi:hypothetical protein